MFILKKIIAPFFFPVPIISILLLTGIGLLWFSKRQKAGKIAVTAGLTILILFSYEGVTDGILGKIENRYLPLTDMSQAAGIKWVVVLGGSHRSDPKLPPNQQLWNTSLSRLVEGIRIHRLLPESKLVLLGGAPFKPVAEAKVMADTAVSLGVDPDDLILEVKSKDTKDQARTIERIVGKDRFVVVTSAAHMARAMALLNKRELNALPGPTDYWVKERQGFQPADMFPGGLALQKMEIAVHEYLGMIWAKLRGQT